ncbi:hypothetical protein RIVM261_041690 [Rivularia sp. IAM M-261]|nr:hypothetical protein RIVM261_041690 [Rivularia sp. IAM M-261]
MKTQILSVLKLSLLLNVLFVLPAISQYKPRATQKPPNDSTQSRGVRLPAMPQYKPPATQKPPSDYTKSGGVRGCPEEKIPLTILSPTTYVGQTASRRPTFAWFLNSVHETEFRLFEFGQDGKPQQLGETISLKEPKVIKGINKYSLPENYPELAIGKTYLWQVSISCPNMPDAFLIQKAEFKVVEAALPSSKQVITNTSQTVNFYAQQGLWYDALAEALKLSPQGKLGEIGSKLLQDLVTSEQKGRISNEQELQQRIENLKIIANQEK